MQVDLVILGGGCAGLSLARELSQDLRWKKKTVVIEARTEYLNDRSWCFWEPLDPGLQKKLAPLVHHSWLQWRFSATGFSQVHTADGRRYCYIAAHDFYQQALGAIQHNQHVEVWTRQTVTATKQTPRGFFISLESGVTLHAQCVIDTRPAIYKHASQAQLWQIFCGYEVETKHPAFDVSTVGLMENLTSTKTATQFLYVLPLSNTRALIELTQFTKELFTPDQLATELNDILEKKFGQDNFTILRSEQACLPMGLRSLASSNSPHYHYAGTVAGAIRPATGYAFIRIQRWAMDCAASLCRGTGVLPALQSTRLVKSMDRIFLRVLHERPALGASLFQALAERVSGPSLVRFLMDEAQTRDYYQVIMALPRREFLAATLGLNYLLNPR